MHGLGHVQTRREICKSFWAKRMDLVAASNQTRQASYVDMVGQLYVGLAGRQGGRQGLFIFFGTVACQLTRRLAGGMGGWLVGWLAGLRDV